MRTAIKRAEIMKKETDIKNTVEKQGLPALMLGDILELSELSKAGAPRTAYDLEERTRKYFELCANPGYQLRPGIEGYCLALGVSRATLWRWGTGTKGEDFAEIIGRARQIIATSLEQNALNGYQDKILSIFLMKATLGYRENSESKERHTQDVKALTAKDLPHFENVIDMVVVDGKAEIEH